MADIDTATDDYATRFAGPTGQWLLATQEAGTRKLLEQTNNINTILDVGGGHAQLSALFLERNRKLTVAGSAPECGNRLAPFLASPSCQYQPADLLQLPFPDQSFDLVSSFRLLTHCDEWQTLIKELTRTAKTYVILDYPASQSCNAIAPALFGAKKKIEKNTRTWHLFTHAQIDESFAQYGFMRSQTYKQFFSPMVLHRALKCRPLSRMLEKIASGLGLTNRWGSPVIALYTRETGKS